MKLFVGDIPETDLAPLPFLPGYPTFRLFSRCSEGTTFLNYCQDADFPRGWTGDPMTNILNMGRFAAMRENSPALRHQSQANDPGVGGRSYSYFANIIFLTSEKDLPGWEVLVASRR